MGLTMRNSEGQVDANVTQQESITEAASTTLGFFESTESYVPLEKCDKANTECDDLSPGSDCTFHKSLRDMLISFDGDSGMQWRGFLI